MWDGSDGEGGVAKTVLFDLSYYGFASNLPFTLAVKRWFYLSGKLNASI